jgi:hypothetical protein
LLVTTSFSESNRMDNLLKDHRCPTLSVRKGGRFFSYAEKSETSLRKRRSAVHYV